MYRRRPAAKSLMASLPNPEPQQECSAAHPAKRSCGGPSAARPEAPASATASCSCIAISGIRDTDNKRMGGISKQTFAVRKIHRGSRRTYCIHFTYNASPNPHTATRPHPHAHDHTQHPPPPPPHTHSPVYNTNRPSVSNAALDSSARQSLRPAMQASSAPSSIGVAGNRCQEHQLMSRQPGYCHDDHHARVFVLGHRLVSGFWKGRYSWPVVIPSVFVGLGGQWHQGNAGQATTALMCQCRANCCIK